MRTKVIWGLLSLLLLTALPTAAQTIIITPAKTFNWSDADNTTIGIDGNPEITSYQIEFFLTTQVTGGVPSGTPQATVNVGKPTANADGTISSGGILSMIQATPGLTAGTAYIAFASAIGPGGTSGRSSGVGPFGALKLPPAPSGLKTLP